MKRLAGQCHNATVAVSEPPAVSQSVLDLFTQDLVQLDVELQAVCSLAAAPRRSLFGHRRQHLADVGGQKVVHFVALARSSKVRLAVCDYQLAHTEK